MEDFIAKTYSIKRLWQEWSLKISTLVLHGTIKGTHDSNYLLLNVSSFRKV